MMSSPARSCSAIAMIVASSQACSSHGSGTRHSSLTRVRGGNRPASFSRSISQSGWAYEPTSAVGSSVWYIRSGRGFERGRPHVVVRRVVAGQPALQLAVGVLGADGVDLVGMIGIAGELDDHPVGIDYVDRAAIA